METAWERPLTQAERWCARDASRSRFLGISASADRQRRTSNITSFAYLLDFRQVAESVVAECLYAHRVPIVATFPNIREAIGGERDVPLLRDAV